ncbi:MAG: hypothetical protein K2H18_01470, partial [Muribaculaceae bacterium]|nr:hypothetical protein [Muribaculaceae bacterium]
CMNKFYSTVALSALVALSAGAAQKVDLNSSANAKLSEKSTISVSNFDAAKKAKSTNGPRKISAVKDALGFYGVSYEGALTSNEGPQFMGLTISASTAGGDEVIVSGMGFSDVDLKAYIDVDAGTLTIPEQKCFYNTYYQEDVYFSTESINPDRYPNPDDFAFVATFEEDGSLTVPPYFTPCYTLKSQGGYFWAGFQLEIKPIRAYNVNEAEWKVAGTAEFTDGFISPGLIEGTSNPYTYSVPLLYNPKVADEYALKMPYGANTAFAEVNETPNALGYIVFSLRNENCVPVRPVVLSGYTMDWRDSQNDPEDLQGVYVFNNEGLKYYIQEISLQDQVDEVTIVMGDNETYADYISTYDKATQTVTINKLTSYFAPENSPMSMYYWTMPDPSKPNDPNARVRNMFDTKIVLNITNNPDWSGVNSVVADDVDAPAKYFNLQGMEIANPEAGQLVIVKKGNKATKVIVK